MGDYNLTGLSTRSFEQLVQALCCRVLGAGTVVFGDGPDGGREATYTGRLSNFLPKQFAGTGMWLFRRSSAKGPKGGPKRIRNGFLPN